MPRLLLLRHASAEPESAKKADHARSLTGVGRAMAFAMGRAMTAAALRPDRVLMSSALRTVETWHGLDLATSATVRVLDTLYLASAPMIFDILRHEGGNAACLLLIGHNPGLHELALSLIISAAKSQLAKYARLNHAYPPAAMVEFYFESSWATLDHSAIILCRLMTPENLV